MGKYNRNLIVSVLPGHSTQLLEMKCKEDGTPTDVIIIRFDGWGDVITLSEEDRIKFSKLNRFSHIYLHGHCDKGYNALADKELKGLHYLSFAEMIATHINLKNIDGLCVRIFACHSAAGPTGTPRGSFAELLQISFRFFKMDNIKVISNTDPITILQNPYTKQIYTYTKTDLEQGIVDASKANRTEVLLRAKSAFLRKISSPQHSSYLLDGYTFNYIMANLSPEKMLDGNQIAIFMANLCEYLLQRGFLTFTNASFLISVVATLSRIKEVLTTTSLEFQSAAFDHTMHQLKLANYSRKNTKILFQWSGKKVEAVDYLESKRALIQ